MPVGFVGEYIHSIDAKGRVTIPAKIRHDFETGIILTVGLDNCLWGYTRPGWEAFRAKLAGLPSGKMDVRTLTRFIFSQASDNTLDRQGRVLIPENLRIYAELDDEAVIVGVGERIELWSTGRWQEFKAEQQANLNAIAEQLSEFGI